jgi:sugar phosphate permease
MYAMSFIDRVNMAMAAPAMRAELGLSLAAIGFAAGFFLLATSSCRSRPAASPRVWDSSG